MLKKLLFISVVLALVISLSHAQTPGGADLRIIESDIEPVPVGINEDFHLEVVIQNYGHRDATNVTITIEKSAFLVLKGEDVINIGDLCSFCKRTLTYNFHVSPEATSGDYEIDIEATWGTFERTSKGKTVNIIVEGSPSSLDVADVKTNPIKVLEYSDVTLIIRIANFGDGDAKRVKTTIDLPFTGEKTAYLGKIEPDDDAPAVFTLETGGAGDYNYTLTMTYTDDYGEHITEENLQFVVFPVSRRAIFIFVSVIMLAIIGFLLYKFVFKKEKKG